MRDMKRVRGEGRRRWGRLISLVFVLQHIGVLNAERVPSHAQVWPNSVCVCECNVVIILLAASKRKPRTSDTSSFAGMQPCVWQQRAGAKYVFVFSLIPSASHTLRTTMQPGGGGRWRHSMTQSASHMYSSVNHASPFATLHATPLLSGLASSLGADRRRTLLKFLTWPELRKQFTAIITTAELRPSGPVIKSLGVSIHLNLLAPEDQCEQKKGSQVYICVCVCIRLCVCIQAHS